MTRPANGMPATCGLAMYNAAKPWGPWTRAYTAEPWDMGESAGFPTKWMGNDGTTLFLVYAGGDAFNLRRAEFVLRGSGR
jgi:hypothetical protein